MGPPLLTAGSHGSYESINQDEHTGLQDTRDQPNQLQYVDESRHNDRHSHPTRESSHNEFEHTTKSSMTNHTAHHHEALTVYTILKISLRRISWRLYLSLLLTRLIPTVYKTTRVFYLGDLTDDDGVNITSQLAWVQLCLEVVQDALMLPLYYTIGMTLRDERETANRLKTGILFTILVHLVFSGVIVVAARPLVEFMEQDEKLVPQTVTYIRLEMAAIPFNGVVQFVTVVFTLYKWQFHIYALLLIEMALSVILDTFLLSQISCSLKLGVNGIAYGNIATNGLASVYCVSALIARYGTPCLCSKVSFSWMKTWGSVGFYSGLDSLIRNGFYALCVLRMMNEVSSQGAYFRANEFLTYWLLVPFSPLADVLKQDAGASTSAVMNYKLKTAGYTTIAVTIGLVWCISVPAWKPFFETVLNIPESDVDVVYNIVLILMPAYIVFMMNTMMDSVFIGKGKTVMLAIQSIITNMFVFGSSFILYLCRVYTPTLINISVLFSISITVDSCITTGLYVWFLKKVDYEI